MEFSKDLTELLTTIPLTPVTIRKLFLLLARAHFSSADNYGPQKEKFKRYIYSPEKTATLRVDLDNGFDPKDSTRNFPMVLIGVGDIDYKRVGYADSHKDTPRGAGREYVREAAAQIVISHVAEKGDEALNLADLSLPFFNAVRGPLKEKCGSFKHLELIKSSALYRWRPEEKAPYEGYASNIIMEAVFETNWKVYWESHRIKTINTELCRQFVES